VIGDLKRWRIRVATVLSLLATVMSTSLLATGSVEAHAGSGSPAKYAVSGPPEAHLARTLKATDTAHLRYVSASGSELLEEGKAVGTLPGKMRASVNVGANISGNFTIYTKVGTIKGRGEATPHGSGEYESFAGTVTVKGGTGRFAHAHGETKLYGTFDRGNYALVIQTTGTLSY
jgi:hypothetical protein